MRLWSIHPQYLDSKGLVACWRESLLAKKVLEGKAMGYINHPQLIRFRSQPNSLRAINHYLQTIYLEATARGYKFNKSKFKALGTVPKITVTNGQIKFEFNHLKNKLKKRNKTILKTIDHIQNPEANSLFKVIIGQIEQWEKSRTVSR